MYADFITTTNTFKITAIRKTKRLGKKEKVEGVTKF